MFHLTKNHKLSVATKDQLTYPRQISDGLPIDDMRLEFLSRGDEFDRCFSDGKKTTGRFKNLRRWLSYVGMADFVDHAASRLQS